jgi:glycosyltransferase involved in cell wall biosynthesis
MKSDSPILTIAIPTYNRATMLQAQLERLLPQLRPEVRLCVYDNASPDETREVVAKYLSHGISYFRAVSNCGGGRNVFRCLEECQTEWLWILSDDDLALPDAVTGLLAVLRNQRCDFIHASTNILGFKSEVVVSDVPTLLEHTRFAAVLWISGGVYRMAAFRPLFRVYNESLSTWGPHMIMVLSLLESGGGKVLLSPLMLAEPNTSPPTYSTLDGMLRMSLAPEYLHQPAHQRLLSERIYEEWFSGAFFFGLRETGSAGQIQRWKRVLRQVKCNSRAYQGQGVWRHIGRNWFRAGRRKQSLRWAVNNCIFSLLNGCPGVLFHVLIKALPLSGTVRDHYDKRQAFSSSQ